MEILETTLASPSVVPPAPPQVTAGSLIGRTFSVWARNVLPFSLVVLVLQAPVLALQLWIGPDPAPDPARWRQLLTHQFAAVGIALLGVLINTVATGALTYGVLQSLDGRRARAGELLGFGFRRLWPVLVTSLNAGVRIVLWTLLLVVPGIVAIPRLFIAVPARVAEPHLGSNAAVARSRELTRGRRGTIFLALLVFWLVAIPATAIVSILGLQRGLLPFTMATTITWALQAVANSLYPTAAGVTYHDLRLEKEGVDTARLAAVFE